MVYSETSSVFRVMRVGGRRSIFGGGLGGRERLGKWEGLGVIWARVSRWVLRMFGLRECEFGHFWLTFRLTFPQIKSTSAVLLQNERAEDQKDSSIRSASKNSKLNSISSCLRRLKSIQKFLPPSSNP